MNELSNSLRKIVDRIPILVLLLPAASVLALIAPALKVAGWLVIMPGFYYDNLSELLYITYLLGLLLCVASRNSWAPAVAFTLNGIASLIALFSGFTLGMLIATAFYGLLAVLFFRMFAQTEAGAQKIGEFSGHASQAFGAITGSVSGMRQESTGGFCSNCGQPMEANGQFCPGCGTPYAVPSKLEHTPQAQPSGYRQSAMPIVDHSPIGRVQQLFGSVFSLGFAVLFTAGVLCSIILQFSFASVLSYVLMILICIGCWVNYVGARTNQLQERGLNLINGALVAQIVMTVLEMIFLLAIVVLASIALSKLTGDMEQYLPVIIGVAIGIVAFFVLMICYYKGLRKTVISARNVLRSGYGGMAVSMYSVVIMCIGMVTKLISLGVMNRSQAFLQKISDQLLEYCYWSLDSNSYNALETVLNGVVTYNNANVLTTLLMIAAQIVAVIILINVRKEIQSPAVV